MSIDHTYRISSDGFVELDLNIAGLDAASTLVDDISATLFAYDSERGNAKFTCKLTITELQNLYHHLSSYNFIVDSEKKITEKFFAYKGDVSEIIDLFEHVENETVVQIIQHLAHNRLSHDDVNTILGRKDALEKYNKMLDDTTGYAEKDWQKFFEENEWIFGYGLKYKYLKILQRESHVSRTDLNGGNDVITDFLMSDSRFTKLVELKKPTTKLFEKRRNRADSWRLSSDLTDAVSQILAQKANWEVEGVQRNFKDNGDEITEKAYDVECLLVIGSLSSIEGTDKEKEIKLKTIELYRRNLRSIEILFYDELFERASFIVNND